MKANKGSVFVLLLLNLSYLTVTYFNITLEILETIQKMIYKLSLFLHPTSQVFFTDFENLPRILEISERFFSFLILQSLSRSIPGNSSMLEEHSGNSFGAVTFGFTSSSCGLVGMFWSIKCSGSGSFNLKFSPSFCSATGIDDESYNLKIKVYLKISC